jgi:CBS domain-containing protein
MATLGQICVREVLTTTRATTVADAARLMRDGHVGSLVVVEERDGAKRPIGIITDRDIVVEVTALDLDASDISVGEVMSFGVPLVTARDIDGFRETIELMRHHGLRRLPIVSSRGHLVGIVSSDDLLKAYSDDITALGLISSRERSREVAQRRPVSV